MLMLRIRSRSSGRVHANFASSYARRSAPIDTPTAYFEIVDGSGDVVVSSRGGENMMVARFEAGISYYARVVAADTMGATIGYRFTLYERE